MSASVICLDSGAGNYDQLWLTTSLRGMASTGTLKVEVLTEGVHSGDASGLVPSSFRIMRQVLDRLEDSASRPTMLPEVFHCEVPSDRLAQAQATAAILGDEVYKRFPWAHYDCGGSTQLHAADHHRPGRGPAQPHLDARHCRHRVPRACRPCRTRAMCCAPTPPSSCRCACRRWSMPPGGARDSRPCSKTTRPIRHA
jgi:hypothetical protein